MEATIDNSPTVAAEPTESLPISHPSSDPLLPCPFHDTPFASGGTTLPECLVTELGCAIHMGYKTSIEDVIRRGRSPNRPCHMITASGATDSPLGFVVSRRFYYRSDECFLALLEGGADVNSQAQGELELWDLKDRILVFAFRPTASLEVLEAVLDMGIAETEQERERLVTVATCQPWYHGDRPCGREIWTMQDDTLQRQRQRLILSKVPLSEEQRARFWCEDGERPEEQRGFRRSSSTPCLADSFLTRLYETEC